MKDDGTFLPTARVELAWVQWVPLHPLFFERSLIKAKDLHCLKDNKKVEKLQKLASTV